MYDLRPPRPQRPLLSPGAALVQKNSETMERELIFGLTRSCEVYRQVRDLICPYNPERLVYRHDFTVSRYNILYQVVDAWYRRFDSWLDVSKLFIPPLILGAYLIDWFNQSKIEEPVCDALIKEIQGETAFMQSITVEHSMALINSAEFEHWIQLRVLDHTLSQAGTQKLKGALTLSVLQADVEKALQQCGRKINRTQIMTSLELTETKYTDGEPVVPGVLDRGHVILLGGTSKSYKTQAALQLAVGVAKTGRWLGRFDCKPGKVLYVNFELAPVNMQQRYKDLLRTMGVSAQNLEIDFSNLRSDDISERDERGRPVLPRKYLAELSRQVKERAYSLVVVDPLYRLNPEGREENSNGDMGALMVELLKVATQNNVGMLVPCHFSKGNQHAKSPQDRISGAGAITRAADGMILLTQHEDEESNSYVVELVLGRQATQNPFVITMEWPLFRLNPELEAVVKKTNKAAAKGIYDPNVLLKYLQDGMTTGEHLKAVSEGEGMSRKTFNRHRDELVGKGLMVENNGQWSRSNIVDLNREIGPENEAKSGSKPS